MQVLDILYIYIYINMQGGGKAAGWRRERHSRGKESITQRLHNSVLLLILLNFNKFSSHFISLFYSHLTILF